MADPRLIDLSGVPADDPEDEAAFYFDIGDPECWLAAERVIQELGRPAPWVPLASNIAYPPRKADSGTGPGDRLGQDHLPGGIQRASRDGERRPPAQVDPARAGSDPIRSGHPTLSYELIEQIAGERGLLPFKPPEAPQAGNRDAALAATYAKQAGKVVAFTLAAMRQCWCAGRDLGDRSTLLLAGAAAEIHPNALEKAFGLKSLNAELDRQLERAAILGIDRVPAVRIGRNVYFGDSGVDEAAVNCRS